MEMHSLPAPVVQAAAGAVALERSPEVEEAPQECLSATLEHRTSAAPPARPCLAVSDAPATSAASPAAAAVAREAQPVARLAVPEWEAGLEASSAGASLAHAVPLVHLRLTSER